MTFSDTVGTVSYPKVPQDNFDYWNTEENVVVLPSVVEEPIGPFSAEFNEQVIFLTNAENHYANSPC